MGCYGFVEPRQLVYCPRPRRHVSGSGTSALNAPLSPRRVVGGIQEQYMAVLCCATLTVPSPSPMPGKIHLHTYVMWAEHTVLEYPLTHTYLWIYTPLSD